VCRHETTCGSDYHQEADFPPDFKTTIANWILRIRECCKLTQTTTDEIIQRVTDLNQFILSQASAVTSAITAASMDASSCPELEIFLIPMENLVGLSRQKQSQQKVVPPDHFWHAKNGPRTTFGLVPLCHNLS
jgi:hypothetical protein